MKTIAKNENRQLKNLLLVINNYVVYYMQITDKK